MRIPVMLLLALLCLPEGAAAAERGSAGITVPVVLAPFDPHAPGCAPPSGLRKFLGFASDNSREFMQGVDRGLALAAKDRELEYRVKVANSVAAANVRHVDEFVLEGAGAVVASPVDAVLLAGALQKAIWAGAFVGSVVAPPATSILNAPQYLTGKALADAAATYIRSHLKTADVVLLTHDSLEFLAPRFVAMRDVLEELPGVTVIADISPPTVDNQGGFKTMQTILQAHQNVDVVLGADTVVLGALEALRAAGKDRADQFLGGIDGEPAAVYEIERGGGPYKASISLASPVFGYAMGQHAADWLEGKSVPQAMDILPVTITQENLANYRRDISDPKSVFDNAARRATYLRAYGNICFDKRDEYLNFPWSSEPMR